MRLAHLGEEDAAARIEFAVVGARERQDPLALGRSDGEGQRIQPTIIYILYVY